MMSYLLKMMATHLIKVKKLGRYLVEQKLFQHGIELSLMDPVLSNLYKISTVKNNKGNFK